MKKKLVVTDEARKDLRGIYDYIAIDSKTQAQAFVADLSAKIFWIAEVGFSGSTRDYISPKLRALPYRGRTIYFVCDEQRIVVLGILHQARDVHPEMFEDRVNF